MPPILAAKEVPLARVACMEWVWNDPPNGQFIVWCDFVTVDEATAAYDRLITAAASNAPLDLGVTLQRKTTIVGSRVITWGLLSRSFANRVVDLYVKYGSTP